MCNKCTVVFVLGLLILLSIQFQPSDSLQTTIGTRRPGESLTRWPTSTTLTLTATPDDTRDLPGLDDDRNGPLQIQRRRLFSDAISSAMIITSLSIVLPPSADAVVSSDGATPKTVTTTISPIELVATWSATAGLNALDPTNPNFVSFDPSAYAAMRDDPSRTPLFKKALKDRIQASPPLSQIVLDLGTGPFALFAIMAAELGAAKVYAIEANPAVAASARQVIQKQGWDDIITVLEGFSTDMTLPDNAKADIIVAEIVGSIASEEGAYATIFDAHQRLLKDPNNPNNWIPNRIQTWAAPASYTLHNLFRPPEFDWTKIAAEPVRFNCRDNNLGLLDDPQCVEDIVFADIVKNRGNMGGNTKMTTTLHFSASDNRMQEANEIFSEEYRKGGLPKTEAIGLARTASHSCTGIALWPRLFLPGLDDQGNGLVINSRSHPSGDPQRSHWQTVLPIMGATPAMGIQPGDSIDVTCQFDIFSTRVNVAPSYRITAQVFATGGTS